MVFALASAVAGFVKVRYLVDKAIIDNMVFRSHYHITSAILFLCCILSTANSFIGPPIECIYDDKKLEHVINTFCWIMSTFTLPEYHQYGLTPGVHVAKPGVGPGTGDESAKQFHKYYQWVPFMLFLQGVLFYAPHWVWKNWEDGKVRMISDGMRGAISQSKEELKRQRSRLVRYIVDSMSLHNWYAIGYFFCEILNFCNVILNIFLTDKFLGGKFLRFGLDVAMDTHPGEDFNEAERVFPRVTKCTFQKYGPTGTLETRDSMCVMALNVINEKVYIFLWYWFITLAILSFITIVYSIALISSTQVRKMILQSGFKFRVPQGVSTIVEKTSVGDFLLLHLLGQNINTMLYGQILDELSQELNPKAGYERESLYPALHDQ